jgi:hypothetical protein
MKIALYFILFLIGFNLCAQSALPYRSNGLWGVIDENKKVLLKPQYDYIFNYKNAPYTIFLDHNRYGVLDQKGKVVLKALYKEIRIEQQEFFVFKSDKEFGLKDPAGKVLLQDIYKNIQLIGLDVIIGENDSTKVLFNTDKKITKEVKGYQIQKIKNLFLLQNKDSTVLLNLGLEPVFSSPRLHHYMSERGVIFYNDLSRFEIPFNVEKTFPKNAIPIGNFNSDENTYVVLQEDRYGIYSTEDGKFLLDSKYENIESVSNFFKIKQDSKYGLIDNRTKIVIPIEYADVFVLGDLFYVQNMDYKSGLIRQNGQVVIPIRYDFIEDFSTYYTVWSGKNVGIYSRSGIQIEPCAFEMIKATENDFKCYSGSIKNKEGKVIKYKKVVSFTLENGQKKGRVEFTDVGIINIESIMGITENGGAKISMDSIYRWKRKKKKVVFDREEFNVELWGFKDTTYKRYLISPKFSKIDVFLDRNYSLAKKFNYGRRSVVSFPLNPLLHGGDYELIDHDRVKRFKADKGFMSLSDVYKNKTTIEYFMGNHFNFFSLDSLQGIKYAFIDEENEDQTIRAALTGKYKHCGINDQMAVNDIQSFVSQINSRFNDSVVFTKKNFIGFSAGFKNSSFKIDNGNWILIDKDHQRLSENSYEYISNPIRKKYISKYKGSWGVMTKEGVVLPHDYDAITRLRSEVDSVFVTEKKQFQEFIIDSIGNRVPLKEGIKILSRDGGVLVFTEKGKYGLMDGKFKPIFDADFGRLKYMEHGWFRYRKKGKMGLISVDGNLIPPKFKELSIVNSEYIIIHHKKKKGLLDDRGDTVLSPIYSQIDVFQEVVLVKKEGDFYLGQISSSKLKKVKGEFIGRFSEGFIFQQSKSITLVNGIGKVIRKLSNSKYLEHSDSMILVMSKGVRKIYNSTLQEVFQGQGDYQLLSGPYYVETIKKDKFVREVGTEKIVDRGTIMKVSKFDHLILYKNHGKYRIINSITNEMFHFQHEVAKVMTYHKDYFIVQYKNRTQGFCDLEGKNIYNRNFQSCQKFESNFSVVKDKNELKIFSRQGKLVEGLVYHTITPLYDGFFKAQILKAYGLASENGEVLIENEYDKINYSNNNLVQLHKKGDVFYYNFQTKEMIK